MIADRIQDALEALVTEMESLSSGQWELGRTNITSWANDLGSVTPTRDLASARDRVFDLSKRIDILTRPPIQEESDSPEEDAPEEEAANTPEPQQDEEGDDEIPTNDPEVIENESSVCIPFPFLFPLLTYP